VQADALLRALKPLALDLRWAWSNTAQQLWERIDADLWRATYSPWVVVQAVGKEHLATLGADESFVERLETCRREQRASISGASWFSRHPQASALQLIAYFSMEFGLNEALPIYSGGLGVLAGDHLKSASDLGVPVLGIGLLYSDGYFRQILDESGGQAELYPRNDSDQLPIEPLRDASGARIRLPLIFPGRTLYIRAWEARVGRTRLLLLDCNDPANHPADRAITNRLYGGDVEQRLQQELVLGVGGRRLLGHLGLQPDLCHLNEGHAAFAVLEHAREIMATTGCDFSVALRATRAGTIFTTHTSVEAAFDRFSPDLVRKYLTVYAGRLQIDIERLIALGRLYGDHDEPFTMAFLALRGASRINAVSRLHGEVSRDLFAKLFPRFPIDDVPVEYVTNGVHIPSWASPEAEAIRSNKTPPSDATLLAMRNAGRERLVGAARERLTRRLLSHGASEERIAEASRALDPTICTIGFARRFATYKRPTLLLSDPDRLARLLLNTERPLQLLVAGKAHPHDIPGKALIRAWLAFAERPDVRHRIVFIDDYDLSVAEELVRGCDVWLNTPRRPWEASGTSGMKVLVNGGLNLSEIDGWWAEAATPEVGWALGDGAMHDDDAEVWDRLEAEQLYQTIENDLLPRFYNRDAAGIPHDWLTMMKASMEQLTDRFSSDRMVREYTERFYLPAALAQRQRLADRAGKAAELEHALTRLATEWSGIGFSPLQERRQDGRREVAVAIHLGDISPSDVRVELYAESPRTVIALTHRHDGEFGATIDDERPLEEFTARVFPAPAGLISSLEAPLIAWQR